jgi:tripartite-type tricarboxylate transporter receptor subunit TctC
LQPRSSVGMTGTLAVVSAAASETAKRLPLLSVLSSLVLLACGPTAVYGQAYPNKVIRLVVGYPPGGTLDAMSRPIASKLGQALGQSVIIDNRGGAAGNIAAEYVAKAQADGYTLLMVAAPHAVNPSLFRSVAYDPVKDFVAVTQITANDSVLVVHPSVPAKTIKEFIALAKEKKGTLSYASGGIGTTGHLGMELFKPQAGFEALHVPYKGGGQAITDVIAGQVNAYMLSPALALPHLRSGKLRAIAGTGPKRSELLPDIPTIAESGFPGYEVRNWQGMVAPAGTPAAVVNRLFQELSKILKLPEVIDQFKALGVDAVGSGSPEEFGTYIEAEVTRYAKVIKQAGIKAD